MKDNKFSSGRVVGNFREARRIEMFSDHQMDCVDDEGKCEYLEEITSQLVKIASSLSDPFLTYLLSMASQEASLQRIKLKVPLEISAA